MVEVNASDTRNKADSKRKEGIGGKTSNRVKEMVTNSALAADASAGRRQLLIMDEVDGMSGAPPPRAVPLDARDATGSAVERV